MNKLKSIKTGSNLSTISLSQETKFWLSRSNITEKHAGIARSTFILIFSLTAAIIKNLLNETKTKERKSIVRLLC